MDVRKKTIKIGILFIAMLFIGGLILMYKGNDAVALAVEKKEGILTAEQVKVSFDSVSGRLVNEAVKEAQEVRKGDVLMVLDSTDVDLSIAKTEAQIAQLEAQIRAGESGIGLGYAKASTDEQQSFRQIDQQRAALNSAQSTYANQQLDFNRKAALLASGAIAQSELDNAQTSLDVAAANVRAQQEQLSRLLGGAADTGDTDSMALPTIVNERQETANKTHDVEALRQQKRQLEVGLKELQVKKDRLTLRAPEDGRVLKVIAKQGEMISPSVPVILLESKRCYYDLYLSEKQIAHLSEGSQLLGHTVAGDKKVAGTIRIITQAPGFADLKMSREKGQADLSAFQVRIDIEPQAGVLPGMTIGVDANEFSKG